jgi:hypothetical protein
MQTPAKASGIYSVVGYSHIPDTLTSYKERAGKYTFVGYTKIEDYIDCWEGQPIGFPFPTSPSL